MDHEANSRIRQDTTGSSKKARRLSTKTGQPGQERIATSSTIERDYSSQDRTTEQDLDRTGP